MSKEQLISRLKKRDSKALEELYDSYSGALYGVIRRIVRSDEVAEEILQDTFLRVWSKIHMYDPKKGKIFTWMMQIGRNLAINKRQTPIYSQMEKTDSLKTAVYKEAEQLNIDALDLEGKITSLGEEQRDVIELIYFQGYTHTAAAEALNIPLGTLKTRVRLAIQNLRKVYMEWLAALIFMGII